MAEDLEEAFDGLGAVDDGYIETVLKSGEGNDEANYDGADILLPCRAALARGEVGRRVACGLHLEEGI